MEFEHEFVTDMFKEICEVIGFDVDDTCFSGFWSQGDGASFTGSYRYAKGAAKRIRAEYPTETELHAIADMLQEMQKRNFYQVIASITRQCHMYCHENTVGASVERDSENYQDVTSDAESIVDDATRRLCQWYYHILELENEYQESWQNGQAARDLASEMRDAGRDMVAACRDIRKAWRYRNRLASHGMPASVMRVHIRKWCDAVRDARDDYQEKRGEWSTAISDFQFNRDAWKEGYRT